MLKKVLSCLLLKLVFIVNLNAQISKDQWVDSVFNTMELEQKIGQLFMMPVNSNSPRYLEALEDEIKNHHIGGVIFMSGGPVRQANLTRQIQKLSAIPLLIGQEASQGLGATLDSTITFPTAEVLGAIVNDSLIYFEAREIARQMKAIGIHLNFAPGVSINTNPDNPVSIQSFGSDKFSVASKSAAFLKGLQDYGILACARNFSLTGLTITDVQKGLPIVKPFADSVSIYPFKKLAENGLTGVMPSPADFPLFYQQKNLIRKNKLSANAMTSIFAGEWLKQQMNYKGLLFVDIHGMQSANNKYKGGEAEMLAFQTGNDVLAYADDVGPAIRRIKKLLKKQTPYLSQLDNSVKKILAAKYDAGLAKKTLIDTNDLVARLNSQEANLLNLKIQESAITVVRNLKNTLPVITLEDKDFAYLNTDETSSGEFLHYLEKYIAPVPFAVNEKSQPEDLKKFLQDKEVIIVGIHPKTTDGVIQKLFKLLQEAGPAQDVIICDFGRQGLIKQAENFSSFITAYSNTPEMMRLIPQVIFGALEANGHLPFTASPALKYGIGNKTASAKRFAYSIPEDVGMDNETLKGIETIAKEAITTGATPGCHVLVAKNGKVIYDRSFGYQTYENKIPVTDETIYDLASVTKVSTTLQAVMFLYEKGMIDINKKASAYLPELKGSNKSDFTIKDILTHQAGLWPFLPFWAQTIKDNKFLPEYYSTTKSEQYPYTVSDNLYGTVSIRDSLWNWIIKAKIREKPSRTPFDYKYSDMGFYILQHLAERLLNQPLEDFIQQNLYEPLGSSTTGYLPLERFPVNQIAPTENDKLFRKSLLIGTVHDQGAAMHGGVAGHAGLFSNANDLAKLGQMLLQEGSYGGYQYYKPETVRTFTQKQFVTSRRGLGWDRPIPGDPNSGTSVYSSEKSFGHTGFTGTCIWVDPEFNLVYVFLSNRVHPDMTNNKLINANIRPRIHDMIYKSIFEYGKKPHLILSNN